jgi:hypothetical protein
MIVVIRLYGWRNIVSFRIRRNGSTDRGTQGATHDSTVPATDFVTDGCTSRTAKSAAYSCVQ